MGQLRTVMDRCRLSSLCAALLIAPTIVIAQGSLTPPGQPTPTMKTLDQVEPRIAVNESNTPGDDEFEYVIETPGSYYLTANLEVTRSNAIAIRASGVTLDLNGFQISRATGSGGFGIQIATTAHRCVVKNGTISGFENGLYAMADTSLNTARAGVFSEVRVADCSACGILGGKGWLITDCLAYNNEGNGIASQEGSAVRGCISRENDLIGISVSSGGLIEHCIATSNGADGIAGGSSSTIAGCQSAANVGAGIVVGQRSIARANTCVSNQVGILVGSNFGCADGNFVALNKVGIAVDGIANLIVRNTAHDSTTASFEINAGNRYGPIINLSSGAAPAVIGETADDTTTTTHPWANFASRASG